MEYPPRRAGHADRDRYVEHLANMVATGYLLPAEFEERRDKALTSATADELCALIRDLPALPGPKMRKVTWQLAGDHIKFSPFRWVAGMLLGLAFIVFPGPIMSEHFGGFDHTPLHGALPVLLIFVGVAMMLASAFAFSPDDTETVEEK